MPVLSCRAWGYREMSACHAKVVQPHFHAGWWFRKQGFAMLKDGYGGIINNMAKAADVRYGHKVAKIIRGTRALLGTRRGPITTQI